MTALVDWVSKRSKVDTPRGFLKWTICAHNFREQFSTAKNKYKNTLLAVISVLDLQLRLIRKREKTRHKDFENSETSSMN